MRCAVDECQFARVQLTKIAKGSGGAAPRGYHGIVPTHRGVIGTRSSSAARVAFAASICAVLVGCDDERAPPAPYWQARADSGSPGAPAGADGGPTDPTRRSAGDAGRGCEPNEGLVLVSDDAGVIVDCVAEGRMHDIDCDGFGEDDGDCDDCSAEVNPGAIDLPGNEEDDDCSGEVDDTLATCDGALALDSDDPFDAARAIGLCERAEGDRWGVLRAEYTRADGTREPAPIGHGLLSRFGPNVATRQGKRMLVLSSGTARTPEMEGFAPVAGHDHDTSSETPEGYPMDFPSCEVMTADDTVAYDSVALELDVRVPTNARGFRFAFSFYTSEYPVFVCSAFNDYFVVLQDPAPERALHANISFDSMENPVSVNIGFVEVCAAMRIRDRDFPCARGTEELLGTGFEDHGATGWLETESSVTPGTTLTLRFAIWDMGDHIRDSTVLIDDFEFVPRTIMKPRTVPLPDRPL